MTWSLFENTLPQNVFVFARHDVSMNRYNSYVVIANNYDTALAILCHAHDYAASLNDCDDFYAMSTHDLWKEYKRLSKLWDQLEKTEA